MKKILVSLSMLVFVGTLAAGATGAFFSDTETSSGNTFTAGAIDLKIDNTSYYNGNVCQNVATGDQPANYQWVGPASFPVPGTACTTSWTADDLQNGQGVTIHKFFDFSDIKPSDYSEDTISLHVNNNDSYLCANVTLTSNKDNDCNTPEKADDPSCGTGDANANGELAQNVNFIWWADLNGDNVLESNETVLPGGALGDLPVGGSATVALADSKTNIWNPSQTGGPIAGNVTKYIGKAWCLGTITAAPLPPGTYSPNADNAGPNGTAPDGIPGQPEDGGYHCNGSLLNNASQTDSSTADVTFTAVQSRHNDGYMCVKSTTLTLVKKLVNDGGGTAQTSDFTLTAGGPTPLSGHTGDPSVTNATVGAGTYTLGETGPAGYSTNGYSCVVNNAAPVDEDTVSIADGDTVVCTITNTFKPAKLTVTKIVVNNNGGTKQVSDFHLFVDDGSNTTGVTSGVQATLPPGTYSVLEQGVAGYQASYSNGCTAGGQITLVAGDVKTCTITNTELPAHITLNKIVTGTGTLASNTLFGLSIDGVQTPTGASVAVTSNAPHAINEVGRTGYTFVGPITGDAACPSVLGGTATLSEGQAITCTITNHQN